MLILSDLQSYNTQYYGLDQVEGVPFQFLRIVGESLARSRLARGQTPRSGLSCVRKLPGRLLGQEACGQGRGWGR
jgi:hypothetical protein